MKLLSFFCFLMLLLTTSIYGAPPTALTNYYSGTVFTPVTYTNAGDTGLSTGTVYVCLPVSMLTNVEFLATAITNDVRPFLSSVLEEADAAIDGMASSNQFSTYTITKEVRYGPEGTNRTVYRAISESQIISVTPTYPTE